MSELSVLMAAVLIGGTLVMTTLSAGLQNMTQAIFNQVPGSSQTVDFSAKFIKP